jgi:diguanylate cyclase (GGDEF)-like protein
MNSGQVWLMAAEIVGISVIMLGCFRARTILGFVPVYTVLGVVFYTCNFLAAGVYVRVNSNLVVSPGTVAFFPAILFVVLLVYITEDALEARKLIYGLLVTNVFTVLVSPLTALHLTLPGALNSYHLAPDLFALNPRISTVSVIALFVDTILIVILYELISRITSALFLRIYVSVSITLALDTLMFITGAYAESPQYRTILASAMLGKLLAAIPYALLFAVYLRYLDAADTSAPRAQGVGAVFRTLTWRQKYELLQAASAHDPLTGIYNRGFFNEILRTQIATASRTNTSLSLLMADIDLFKQINDTKGHQEGDRVLAAVAAALGSCFRASDYVCRYGGEEFAIVLPHTERDNARLLAEKARRRIADLMLGPKVTVTVGVATYPVDAGSADELVRVVDERLYEGKNSGRNRVVA